MKRGIHFRDIKKAQAAMEFLMTYGWALLVVLVAIGALAFFGVLNPGQFLPDQCTMFAGFSCTGYYATVTGTVLKLTFQNGLGYSMDVTCATCGIDVFAPATGATALAANLVGTNDCTSVGAWAGPISDGGSQVCEYDTSGIAGSGTKGTRVKGTIAVIWRDSALNTRSRTGNFAVTIEA